MEVDTRNSKGIPRRDFLRWIGIGGGTIIVGSRIDELEAFSAIRSFTGAAYLFASPAPEAGSADDQ